ncbi:CUN064 hypothetical protein [Culex nigripalpus nucleopolyhedrovirus]|uniref:Uncharacterized protein n=1 Tax=Culex nigripalpus nucleopolyhedrovirus (isolate Florida/1997) TaxID=645993 RepID=Q919L2_NPVCO|nr:CUN064 hypothetical protein [Culex nigripalpus nucleopolyhedrovirus]AAK94142.1 CUN064 hypothetical protein [Culex nigripalpus nucleopolyhedrovirus]
MFFLHVKLYNPETGEVFFEHREPELYNGGFGCIPLPSLSEEAFLGIAFGGDSRCELQVSGIDGADVHTYRSNYGPFAHDGTECRELGIHHADLVTIIVHEYRTPAELNFKVYRV